MNKAPSGRNSIICVVAVLAALFTGCYGPLITMRIPFIDGTEEARIPESWQQFGAYMMADDMIFSTRSSMYDGMSSSRIDIRKKIRILSPDGFKYATVPIPRQLTFLKEFRVVMYNADGVKVPLPVGELKRKYLETEKVVVPKVSAGATITIECVFTGLHMPTTLEHWFISPIPVANARFLLHMSLNSRSTYRDILYDNTGMIKERREDDSTGSTVEWTASNMLPPQSTPFSPRLSDVIPRVALCITPMYDRESRMVSDWEDLARSIRANYVLSEDASVQIRKTVREIIGKETDPEKKASLIITWLQNNIRCAMAFQINDPDEILKKRRANLLSVAVLGKRMLDAAGIKNELLLTRDHSRGGFNKVFLSPGSCIEGLLAVTVNGTVYIATPVFEYYPLGSYPTDFAGCPALNIDKGTVQMIPPSRWDHFAQSSCATIPLGDETSDASFSAVFEQHSTYAMRSLLDNMTDEQMRSVFDRMLTARSPDARLGTYTCSDLRNSTDRLSLQLHYTPSLRKVTMAGIDRYDFSSYFPDPFTLFDSTRTEPVVKHIEQRIADTLSIRHAPEKTFIIDNKDWETVNALFDASVQTTKNDTSLVVVRTITFHPCSLSVADLAPVFTSVDKLRKNSHIIILSGRQGK